MAWRPTDFVRKGELDNTQPGWTIGWLEMEGLDERINLKLVGNCHPDLAGWKFKINRTEPALLRKSDIESPFDFSGISLDQSGNVGDITADQMVKHFQIPDDELIQRLHAGEQPPFTLRKCLYLEWYSNANGRVVVQSTRLEVERIGERSFELTQQQWQEQSQRNNNELRLDQ